nr:MAG TPA: hypothetical protein [Caudoviricetes sp.]
MWRTKMPSIEFYFICAYSLSYIDIKTLTRQI